MSARNREARILAHHALVLHIAKRMWSKLPSSVDFDDLVGVGMVGLIDAADRFDDTLNISFGCYARIRIQGAIVDSLRKQDWVPRVIRHRSKLFADAQRELASTLGRVPTQSELKTYLHGLGVRDFSAFKQEAHIIPLLSTEETKHNSTHRVGDTLAANVPATDTAVANLELKRHIAAILSTLSEREQTVVQMYYYEAYSLRAIGEHIGVTESRVCQMHRVIRKKLREALVLKGIDQAA